MLIGEVAQRSGISSRMLRHYDRLGVASPSERTAGGYRHYTEDDLRRLFHVEGLRSLGLSLRQIAEVLDGPDFVPVSLVARLVERSRERIAREQELLRTLEQVQVSEPDDWSDVLRTVGLLHGLEANSPSARQRLVLSTAWTEGRDVPLLVEAALRETDPTVAGTLYWALARSGDAAVPALRDALDSPVAEHRHRAVEALEKIHTPLATETLAGGRGDPDPLVRRRATLAAGRRGHLDAIPELVSSSSRESTTPKQLVRSAYSPPSSTWLSRSTMLSRRPSWMVNRMSGCGWSAPSPRSGAHDHSNDSPSSQRMPTDGSRSPPRPHSAPGQPGP